MANNISQNEIDRILAHFETRNGGSNIGIFGADGKLVTNGGAQIDLRMQQNADLKKFEARGNGNNKAVFGNDGMILANNGDYEPAEEPREKSDLDKFRERMEPEKKAPKERSEYPHMIFDPSTGQFGAPYGNKNATIILPNVVAPVEKPLIITPNENTASDEAKIDLFENNSELRDEAEKEFDEAAAKGDVNPTEASMEKQYVTATEETTAPVMEDMPEGSVADVEPVAEQTVEAPVTVASVETPVAEEEVKVAPAVEPEVVEDTQPDQTLEPKQTSTDENKDEVIDITHPAIVPPVTSEGEKPETSVAVDQSEAATDEQKPVVDDATSVKAETQQPTTPAQQTEGKILRWAKNNLPALAAGGATGVGARAIVATFGLAKILTCAASVAGVLTASPVVAAVVTAALTAGTLGAVAGAAAKLVQTAIYNRNRDIKLSYGKEALKGAGLGFIGGSIAGTIMHHFFGAGVAGAQVPADGNHTAFPADGNQTVVPTDGNQTVVPADGNQTAVPADGNQTAVPADGNQTPQTGSPTQPPQGDAGTQQPTTQPTKPSAQTHGPKSHGHSGTNHMTGGKASAATAACKDPTPYLGNDGYLHASCGQVDPYMQEVAARHGYDIKLGKGGVYHKVPLAGVAQAAPAQMDAATEAIMQPVAPKPTRVAKILFVPVQK